MITKIRLALFLFLAICLHLAQAADKPKLTIDEFFNAVDFTAAKLSPDGQSVVIATDRADWEQNIFREDLWLYRDDGHAGGTLTQLTNSGADHQPQWSPDGRWIAFLSDRKTSSAGADCLGPTTKDVGGEQLYLISPNGGESFVVSRGDEVHAFAWSADSRSLYFATRQPWTTAQKEAYQKNWKDVCEYRESERGDAIFNATVADAIARTAADGTEVKRNDGKHDDAKNDDDDSAVANRIATTPWRADELVSSPDGKRLAFVGMPVSQREEKVSEFEIFTVDLANPAASTPPRQLTHNEAVEESIHWAADSKHVFFMVDVGSVEGKYKDVQKRLYWIDADTGETRRWAGDFGGAVNAYAVNPDGSVLAAGRTGTEVQIYSQQASTGGFSKKDGWPGTYDRLAGAANSPRLALVYSSLDKPTEVYLAESADKLPQARPITAFNKLFSERDLPQGKPYRWKADDGTSVEGMLMYPPGKFEAKNLPMFVFIHGGPADADGNHFEADWYQWDRLAATQGWLVFEPNYRGSAGYGDKFLMGIVPEIVSRPGKDILEGVDALVKDGIADPDRLAVGGYSYGGYMTNWLITQTTRFKAAVTGAGAVENVGNWGNDDTTFDDAYFLGGLPWEAAQRYHDEAAIFQINKVKTPTHMVAGSDDIRVAVLEDYLLDHALHVLGIPSSLLIFPGEGHSLDKNPWHGKIKVREELQWLGKYGGVGR